MALGLKKHMLWLAPLLTIIMLTPFTPYIDLALTRYFYIDGHFHTNNMIQVLYDYAPWIANLTAFFFVILLIASFFVTSLNKWRKPALVMVFTLAIGSGLIVHAVLKDNWGRPRPRQVIEFGGKQEFRPYYQPNFFHQPEPSKSFPCGHCSTGFYFLAIGVLGMRYRNRSLLIFGMSFGLVFGFLLGYIRIAQGGHFLSDILISGLIMWFTALGLDRLVFGPQEIE